MSSKKPYVEDPELTEDRPSKSQKKRDMADLQAMGEQLVDLPNQRLTRLGLSEALYQAIRDAQKTARNTEARRRQLQYIGKLMRQEDTTTIQTSLAEIKGDSAEENARFHRLEKLRADFLADEQTLSNILVYFPSIDIQQLRSLRRSTLKEQSQNKPPKSFRALFQLLKSADIEHNSPTASSPEADDVTSGE